MVKFEPMRMLVMLVVVAAAGCARRIDTLTTVRLNGDPSAPCIDRALMMSRSTGYIEQTVDKDAGFFRVIAHTASPKGGGMQWMNVACIDDQTVSVTPMSSNGVLDKMAKNQLKELRTYAARLGIVGRTNDE